VTVSSRVTRAALAAVVATTATLTLTPTGTATPTVLEPIVELTKDNFDNTVTEAAKAKVVTVIKTTAVWCGPCQVMKPVIQRLARTDNATTWRLGELDADKNPELHKRLEGYYLPTMIALKGTDLTVIRKGSEKEEEAENALVKDEIETPVPNRFIGYAKGQETKLKNWIKAKVDHAAFPAG
jgi:thioredoxin-like negative regulator of GroEL